MTKTREKVVLITGAARGFGATLVDAYLSAGYFVVATARQPPEQEVRNHVTWHRLDVVNYESCRSTIDEAVTQHGKIDVLVNNAAAYTAGSSLQDLTPEVIAQELDVTLRGSVYMSKAYVTRMQPQGVGSLIFISSTAALSHEPECGLASVYSAAKAGLIRFAETLHDDISRYGLQTHIVVPGNMSDSIDVAELLVNNSLSYAAAARAVVALTDDTGNLRQARIELLPSRGSARQ